MFAPALRQHQVHVHPQARSAGRLVEELQQSRGDVLAGDPLGRDRRQPLRQRALVQIRVELPVRRERVRDDDPGIIQAEPAALPQYGGGLVGPVDPPRRREPGIGQVETGEPVCSVP